MASIFRVLHRVSAEKWLTNTTLDTNNCTKHEQWLFLGIIIFRNLAMDLIVRRRLICSSHEGFLKLNY